MPIIDLGPAKELRARLREKLSDLSLAERVRNFGSRLGRRLLGKRAAPAESANLLPLLIQVLAAFSKSGTEVLANLIGRLFVQAINADDGKPSLREGRHIIEKFFEHWESPEPSSKK